MVTDGLVFYIAVCSGFSMFVIMLVDLKKGSLCGQDHF